jgi:probable rRNA maturation factor
MHSFRIEINDQQTALSIDTEAVRHVLSNILAAEGLRSAEISVAVVDDSRIRTLNQRHLGHDRATDVLSFIYDIADQHVDGELVLSAETAARVAREYGWRGMNEFVLYLVHGTLHLLGYDDETPEDRRLMRERERKHLSRLGMEISVDMQNPQRQTQSVGWTSHPDKESSL